MNTQPNVHDDEDFPQQPAYDTPVLGPRSERAPMISPRVKRIAFWVACGTLPVGASLLCGVLSRRRTRTRNMVLGAAVVSGALAVVRWQMQRWFTDDTDYVVERKIHGLEIRRYAKQIVAETDIELAPQMHAAMSDAFRRLASYIFPNQIAMKTPVTTARSDRRDASSMRMRPNPSFVRTGPGRFSMRFVMPDGSALDTLPQPKDARVHLREIPEHRVAALRFSGRMTEENIDAAHRALDQAMTHALLTGRGEAVVAAYDPPTTAPFLRRNEIWSKLA